MDTIQILTEATEAANEAGAKWMQEHQNPAFIVKDGNRVVGALLDLCGNAHLQFKDRRKADFKAFLKAELIRNEANATVAIAHNYRMRQEHGLQVACIRAARDVFVKHGITNVRVWDYID